MDSLTLCLVSHTCFSGEQFTGCGQVSSVVKTYYKDVIEGQKEVQIPNCVTAIPMAGAGSRFAKDGFSSS